MGHVSLPLKWCCTNWEALRWQVRLVLHELAALVNDDKSQFVPEKIVVVLKAAYDFWEDFTFIFCYLASAKYHFIYRRLA